MEPFAKLVLNAPGESEQEYKLSKSTIEIGRAALNDIVLQDEKISREHARIEHSEQGTQIIDLGSSNGTVVNGSRITTSSLSAGDTIELGASTLRFVEITPEPDPGVTMLNTEADLNQTLATMVMETSLNDVSDSRLVIHTSDKTWEVALRDENYLIGRDPNCDVFINDVRLSRQHARIVRKGEIFTVHDLNSTNGTRIADERIEQHDLADGDTIQIGKARLVFKRGFRSQELTFVGLPQEEIIQERNPVVIVPGLMGSELWRGNERMWPNVRALFSRPEIFRLPEFEPMDARGLVGEVVIVPNLIKQEQYNRLGDYLVEGLGYERGKDVFEFPYDWRQDVRDSSQKLGEAIENWRIDPPITIIAHSLGCLVTRYYVERLGGKDKVGRLVMIGGPHSGVPNAVSFLHSGPDILPFGLLGDRLRDILITFPSIYQILPTYSCVVDQEGRMINLLSDESWLPEVQRPLLRNAQQFHRELGKKSSVPAVSIFGYGLKTVTQVFVHRTVKGIWKKADLTLESNGDDRIPELSGVLRGTEIHPVQQHHGALYVDNDVKMRLKLELMR
jgi:pSer/pThr/pTyr-binding forkhead associated (FHA) protein